MLDATPDGTLRLCRSWTEVQQSLQRVKNHAVRSPTPSRSNIEAWSAAATNAVLRAFQVTPPAVTVIQAQALLHGVLRDMHQYLLHGAASQSIQDDQPTPSPSYYVSAFEKIVHFSPSSSVEELGVALAYCYIHGSLLAEATGIASALSSMVTVQQDRLHTIKAWIALRQHDVDLAISLLHGSGPLTPLRSFWLACAWVQGQLNRKKHPPPNLPSTTMSADQVWALLQTAVAGDVRPVVCLNIQAWLLTQHRTIVGVPEDVTAGDCLAKAIALDFDHDTSTNLSLFNYAMLLGRLGQWSDTQQALQYCLDTQHAQLATTQTPDPACIPMFPATMGLSHSVVQAHMARACIQADDMDTARVMLHRLGMAATASVSVGPFQTSSLLRDHVFVLLQVNAHREAANVCNAALQRYQGDPTLLLYKADALFCLEQVQECDWTLQQLDTILSGDDDPCDELYAQLLNNQALVLACRGNTDDAIQKLHECRQKFPSCAHALFNLTVLLWRQKKRLAACTTWLAGRQNIKVNTAPEAAKPPTAHVQTGQRDGQLWPQQVAALDRLIEKHWSDHDRVQAIKQTLQVVEHYSVMCGTSGDGGRS